MSLKNRYIILSIFFIILQILVIIRNLIMKEYIVFFWFCDFFPILLSLAFLLKDEQLVKGFINIGFIPQLISSFSLFYAIFLGIDIVGFADILNYSNFYIIVSFLLHLLPLNIALLFTYKIKTEKKSLLYSFIILIIMFILTLIFTSPIKNINYVYNSDFLGFTPHYYTLIWVVLAFVILVLPTYLIQKLLYNFNKSRTRF